MFKCVVERSADVLQDFDSLSRVAQGLGAKALETDGAC
jgi:hypothetical protein